MLDLKSRIKDLKDSTDSLKVKHFCEVALDSLLEIEDYKNKKDVYEKFEKEIIENLIEELEIINNPDVINFVNREKKLLGIKNLGVREAISVIKESEEISAYPALLYLVNHFEEILKTKPEYLIADVFYKKLKSFDWHPIIKESLDNINRNLRKYKDEIAISKLIYELKNSRASYIYNGIKEEFEDYILHRSKSEKLRLIEKLSKFTFEPIIQNLIKVINESRENELVINPSNSNVIVEEVYSPVILENDSEIFAIGYNVYRKTGNKLQKLTEKEILDLDENFIKISRFLANPNVKVVGDKIIFYATDKKIEITNEGISVNGNPISLENFTKTYLKFRLVNYNNDTEILNSIIKVVENFEDIVNIEFAKRIISPIMGGREMDVIKLNESIYIIKEDPQMGEIKFFKELNPLQARSIVLEFMDYDIAESFDFEILNETKKLKTLKNTKKIILESISKLENKLSELNRINDNYIKNSPKFKKIIQVIETKIENLKREYADLVAKTEELISVSNDNIDKNEIFIDKRFKPNMKVYCKTIEKYGRIYSISDITKRIIVILENGEIREFLPNELEIIEEDVEKVLEDHFDVEEANYMTIKDFRVGDRIETKNGKYGIVYSISEFENKIIVIFDNGEIEKLNPKDLVIVKKYIDKSDNTIDDFNIKDKVMTKDNQIGIVFDINKVNEEVIVYFDKKGIRKMKPFELFIVEKVNENEEIDIGDEVELQDGRRGIIQSIDDIKDEVIILCDDGETETVSISDVKLIKNFLNQEIGDDEIEGKEYYDNSVDIKE